MAMEVIEVGETVGTTLINPIVLLQGASKYVKAKHWFFFARNRIVLRSPCANLASSKMAEHPPSS